MIANGSVRPRRGRGLKGRCLSFAERAGVRVYSPGLFYHAPRDRPEAELLLGYGSLSLPQIRRGIARLAGVA